MFFFEEFRNNLQTSEFFFTVIHGVLKGDRYVKEERRIVIRGRVSEFLHTCERRDNVFRLKRESPRVED